MIKSLRFVLLALVLLSMLATGCGAPPTAAPAATKAPAEEAATEAPAATEAAPAETEAAPAETEAAPAETEAAPAEEATEEAAAGEPVNLVMWWWGEQEAPGAQAWLDETVAMYQEANPNITIETVLQSTDSLLPAFASAVEAQEGPDIQYFWGGIWTLESVWAGGVEPVDDLIPAEERAHYINNFERDYDGKNYGVPWYMSGNPLVYNPSLFEQAGLDPANPPKTWDELLDACDKLNAIDVIPISGGLKDGWFGGWMYSILARQTHDAPQEFMAAAVGDASFLDPSFTEYWTRMAELKDRGCWNEDISSLDYQQGMDRFVQGEAAMIFGNDTFLAGWADQMGGWDNIALTTFPTYGDGAMADQYITTAQGLGITSWSQHKQEAADFLVYMHTPDRLKAWYDYTGVIPADDRLDPAAITIPQLKQVFEWDSTIAGPNMENFLPSLVENDGYIAPIQLLFSGDVTTEELAQMTEDAAAKWRDQNPDMVEHFKVWAASGKTAEEKPAEAAFDVKEPIGEPANLVVWWWGEQEAPGAQAWLDETVALYQEANPHITIETVLQSTDSLLPAFASAIEAQEGPDIQYTWGGVWTLEFAWAGGVEPIDDLIPAEERAHYMINFERDYDGKNYGAPWYLSGNPLVYNPKLFEQAGIAGPPETWDELIEDCGKLNDIGIIPISGGLKDGWFGGWLYSILARQTHDSPKEFMAAAVGDASFTDPEFAEYWKAMTQLKEAGCWNEDIGSLDYQQGMDRFVQGEAAMIFGNDTFLKGWAEQMGGWDQIALAIPPKYADGAMANQYIAAGQGWTITPWSLYKKQAAHFLMYMHTPDRLEAWWNYTGVLPADDRFDTSVVDIPQIKQVFEWVTTVPGPNMENFLPSLVENDGYIAPVQLLFSGDITVEELAQMTEDAAAKWRDQNPEMVEHFRIWAK